MWTFQDTFQKVFYPYFHRQGYHQSSHSDAFRDYDLSETNFGYYHEVDWGMELVLCGIFGSRISETEVSLLPP